MLVFDGTVDPWHEIIQDMYKTSANETLLAGQQFSCVLHGQNDETY